MKIYVLTVAMFGIFGFACANQPDDTLRNAQIGNMKMIAGLWAVSTENDTDFCARFCRTFNERPVYLHDGNFPPDSEFDFVSAVPDQVLGPYVNQNSVAVYKFIGRVFMPDSVRFSQILVAWQGAEGAQPIVKRSKEAARKRADSLCYELHGRRIFMDEVMVMESDDVLGLMFNQGYYGWVTRESDYPQVMIDAFFNNPAGSFGIVETEQGYHVIGIEETTYAWETYAAWEIISPIDSCYDVQGNALTSPAFFPGGSDGVDQFLLSEKTKYDSLDVAGQFDYPVVVFFDVLPDGSVSNVEVKYQSWITRGILIDITNLVKSMPKWKPAQSCSGPVVEAQAVIIYL